MPDVECPNCHKDTKIVHYWRTDMKTLQFVDDYKCLHCNHRWVTNSSPADLPIKR